MDSTFQTSFIPKAPIAEPRIPRARSASLLVFIATIVFFAAVAAAVGVYFYRSLLQGQVASASQQLTLAQNSFEPTFISSMQELDRRLNDATTILNNHVTVSPIFLALENLTLKTIRYTRFSYQINLAGTQNILVTMSGQSDSYESIALQSDMFLQNKSIEDPVFSNLSLDPKGNVLFDLSFNVDPSSVLYTNVLQSEAAASAANQTPTTSPVQPQVNSAAGNNSSSTINSVTTNTTSTTSNSTTTQ